MKELAFRLQGCGSESEARRIEVEFVAERANSPEVVGWYACALDGEVIDRLSIRCFGPPPVRLSVIVRLDPSKPDGFAVYPSQYDDCALGAGGALGVCRAHFKRLIGLANARDPAPSRATVHARSDAERIKWARELWNSAKSDFGLAKEYLEGRGITCAARFARRVIRVRWAAKGYRHDAMICAMRDVLTNEFKAAHVTPFDKDWEPILDANGKKARRTPGLPMGAAIKLSSHAEVIEARALVVSEGLETGLSALQLGFWPVWAMGSTASIYSLPMLPGIDELILLGERDNGASERACTHCLRRWQMAGVSATIRLPKKGYGDLNDQLRAM